MRPSERLLRALNPLALEREGVSFVIGASLGIVTIQARFAGPEEWLEGGGLGLLSRQARGSRHARVRPRLTLVGTYHIL